MRLLILIAIVSLSCSEPKPITIHMIGDSTMADKPQPEKNPERGWGQVFGELFRSNVTVRNYAINGRSTKSFINEGRWDDVVANLGAGDYVFIQFGHNDEKKQDPARYTDPFGAFQENLKKFIDETRSKGATPVLLSPIVRRHFNDSAVLQDTHGDYPAAMKSLADKEDVAFIDLEAKTRDLVQGAGVEDSKDFYLIFAPGESEWFPNGEIDNTHLSDTGARAVAKLAAEGICELELELCSELRSGN